MDSFRSFFVSFSESYDGGASSYAYGLCWVLWMIVATGGWDWLANLKKNKETDIWEKEQK